MSNCSTGSPCSAKLCSSFNRRAVSPGTGVGARSVRSRLQFSCSIRSNAVSKASSSSPSAIASNCTPDTDVFSASCSNHASRGLSSNVNSRSVITDIPPSLILLPVSVASPLPAVPPVWRVPWRCPFLFPLLPKNSKCRHTYRYASAGSFAAGV